MGLEGTLLALIVIALIVAVGWNYIAGPISQFWQDISQGVATASIGPQAQKGQQVCTLALTVYGQVDSAPPYIFTPLNVYLGRSNYHPEVASYSWMNCYANTLSFINTHPVNKTSFSIIPGNESLPLDSFAVGSGGGFHMQLVLIGDDGSKVDASVQPLLLQQVNLPSGVFAVPYDFQQTFAVHGLPRAHYHVQIFAGFPINGMQQGEPYDYYVNP